jgi:2-dehydro-3-deoxyglucarate aldolase/4-hydroxy-2-oxoheptanedioate aldolase
MKESRILRLGTWISAGSSVISEMASGMGFDWLLMDLEHGFMQESDLLGNIQAVGGRARVIVRVGGLRPDLIARILDWGADGIMMPHVSGAGQARAVVRAMRYPPRGNRGFSSSSRSFAYGASTPKDMRQWEPPLLLAQIEDAEGVAAAAEIAAVDGVDMLFVGPRDLSLALSVTPGAISYEDALNGVVSAAAGAGKQAGILISPEADSSVVRGAGFDCLAVGSDMAVLRAGYMKIVNTNLV